MNRKEHLINEFLEVKKTFLVFLKHPLSEIKRIPNWNWQRLLGLHCTIAAVSGALAGLIEQKFSLSILIGFFSMPVLTLIMSSVITLFFYYCFQIFATKTIPLRQLFTVILFASIPQFILRIIEGLVPPIALVAMAFTALLLMVGFVENFQLPRKLVIRLIGFLYAILFMIWIWNQATSARFEKSWSPEKMEAPEVHLGK